MSPMPTAAPVSEDPVRIEICRTREDLFRHAALLLVNSAGRALGSRSRFRLAIPGDDALSPLWDLLPQPHFAYQIVWSAVDLYRMDERNAPRLAALCEQVGIPPENQHLLRTGSDSDPIDLAIVAMDERGEVGCAPAILAGAAALCIIVSGEATAPAALRFLGAGAEKTQVATLRPAGGRLIWLLDSAAASQLDGVGS